MEWECKLTKEALKKA